MAGVGPRAQQRRRAAQDSRSSGALALNWTGEDLDDRDPTRPPLPRPVGLDRSPLSRPASRPLTDLAARRASASDHSSMQLVVEAARERVAWLSLVFGGVVCGLVLGVSISRENFVIGPPGALFGCLAILVLALTTAVWRKERSNSRSR